MRPRVCEYAYTSRVRGDITGATIAPAPGKRIYDYAKIHLLGKIRAALGPFAVRAVLGLSAEPP